MTFDEYLRYLLDYVAPPRRTEFIVRTISRDALARIALRGERAGSLPYHDPRVTALVWEVKYYADSRAAALAGAVLADILISIANEELGRPLLIPIPMHRVRRRERGHNQTEVLCEAALTHAASFYEYAPPALLRVRHTPTQQGLSKHERVENLKGSMHVQDESLVRGRVCVVVDDVSTTGATFEEATRALKAAGATRVECVALAYS